MFLTHRYITWATKMVIMGRVWGACDMLAIGYPSTDFQDTVGHKNLELMNKV